MYREFCIKYQHGYMNISLKRRSVKRCRKAWYVLWWYSSWRSWESQLKRTISIFYMLRERELWTIPAINWILLLLKTWPPFELCDQWSKILILWILNSILKYQSNGKVIESSTITFGFEHVLLQNCGPRTLKFHVFHLHKHDQSVYLPFWYC